MKYKKAQTSTDTPIILSILVFQAFIIIMLGFLNVNTENNSVDSINANSTGVTTNTPTTIFNIGSIIHSIKILGWFNTILFIPLEVIIGYIIVKLIRGGG